MNRFAIVSIAAAIGASSARATTVTLSNGRSAHYEQAAVVFRGDKAVIESDAGRLTIPIGQLESIRWKAPPPPPLPPSSERKQDDTAPAGLREELEAAKTALKAAEQKIRSLERLADYLRSEESKRFNQDLTKATERAILSTQMTRIEQERRLKAKALDVEAAKAAATQATRERLDRNRYYRDRYYDDRYDRYDRYGRYDDRYDDRYYDYGYDRRGSDRYYDRYDNQSYRDRYGNRRYR